MNREDYFRSLQADLADDPRNARLIQELAEHLDDHETLAAISGKKPEHADGILGDTKTIARAHQSARRTASPSLILSEAAAFGIAGTPIILIFVLVVATRMLDIALREPLTALGFGALCVLSSIIFHIFALRTTIVTHEGARISTVARLMITGIPVLVCTVLTIGIGTGTGGDAELFGSLLVAVALFVSGAPIANIVVRRMIAIDHHSRIGRAASWYRKHIVPRLGTILGGGTVVYIILTHFLFFSGPATFDAFNAFVDHHPLLGIFIAMPRGFMEIVLMFAHFWFVSGPYQFFHANVTALYAIFFGAIAFVTIIAPLIGAYRRYTITHRLSIPWVAVISVVYFGGIMLLAPTDAPRVTWHVPHYNLSENLERKELGVMYPLVKHLNRMEGFYADYFAYRYGDDLVVTMNEKKMHIAIDDINNPTITVVGNQEMTHGFFLLDAPPAGITCNGKSFTYSGTDVYLEDEHQVSYFCSTLAVNGVAIAEIADGMYAGMTATADGKYAFLLLSTGFYDPSYGYLVELPQEASQ